MVYFRKLDRDTTTYPFDTRLLEDSRCGVVSSSDGVPHDSIYLRVPNCPPWPKAIVSIIICTYGRPESLNETLQSLTQQTFRDFEVVLITEKGNLSELRQKGLQTSKGRIVSFIDDDVYCPPGWLQGVVNGFGEGVLGVSGPTTITSEFKKNRDCFRYKRLRKAQEWFFKCPTTPGKLSPCGCPSMASNDEGCDYTGEVDYLECCNMSVKRKEALDVGGFKSVYKKTSEWCEVDLALEIGLHGRLLFVQQAKLEHRPSRAGIYKARNSTRHRWDNFIWFQREWEKRGVIKSGWRTSAYRVFIWTYFQVKQLGWI